MVRNDVTRRSAGVLAIACCVSGGLSVTPGQQGTPAPTRVVHFAPPATLPDHATGGTCPAASRAAWFREDALRCVRGTTTYDPCFATARAGHVLCGVDPRQPASGTLVALASTSPGPIDRPTAGHRAWFFELADGSTCQPLPEIGRQIDGAIELYACRFGSAGDADAVLGDLDSSEPVWTIQKVMINKKVDPQTIKSMTVAAVKTVWQ